MEKNVIIKILGTMFISALAVTAVVSMAPAEADGQSGGEGSKGGAKTELVEVTQPERRTLTRALTMPATLLADEQVDMLAKTSGYVAKVMVDIGSRVKKGDVLAIIDVPEMKDELRQAEAIQAAKEAKVTQAEALRVTAKAEVQRFAAEYALRKITHDRKVELHKQNVIPEQELDEAKNEIAVAEAFQKIARAKVNSREADVAVAKAEVMMAVATVARIKTLMEYATIRAPFDGVITERFIDPGDFVRSATEGAVEPLLWIAKTDRIRLSLEIPEMDSASVKVGTPVDVVVKALGEHSFPGTITRTAVGLRASTRTMRAEVDLDNADGLFAPGMYAQVTIKLEIKENALMIPSKAIRVRGRETYVLVARGEIAQKVPVSLGYDDGIWAEVLSGIADDEWIITAATGAVTPGTPVKLVPVKQDA
ncbi:MAG: efflux RND transporter periplasmic adaptor subunit [Planctomycetes bacterium]|nr:efflux RND transporter periplasmic adaptor subunit [Planctomycetota bacterium]